MVIGSAEGLRNDWVTQPSGALHGRRQHTCGGPTFRLSAALPAATDTEESRVHLPAPLRTRPAPHGRHPASSGHRLPLGTVAQ